MKIMIIAALLAAVLGVGIPLAGGFGGGGDNEATRLVDATNRTETKAKDVTRSYNDVIPPAPLPPMGLSGSGAAGPSTGGSPENGGAGTGADGTPEPLPTPTRTPTPGEHAVADAMELLNRIHMELEPDNTEYMYAVATLKRAWGPRYERAVDEFYRFDDRVAHAERMAYEYLEVQQRLTQNVYSREARERHEQRDATEQRLVLDWINQANEILAQASAIKRDLDDMNIAITKLELSATFSSVYEGFMKMPLAIMLLNEELSQFEERTEEIYNTFGPPAERGGQ